MKAHQRRKMEAERTPHVSLFLTLGSKPTTSLLLLTQESLKLLAAPEAVFTPDDSVQLESKTATLAPFSADDSQTHVSVWAVFTQHALTCSPLPASGAEPGQLLDLNLIKVHSNRTQTD